MNTPCNPMQLHGARACARFAVIAFLFVCAGAFLHAQGASGSLAGKVLDGAGAPLPGAIVTLAGTSLETATDREGEFYFGNVPAGNYAAHVSYLGLPPQEQAV